jgi:hypothetical protein
MVLGCMRRCGFAPRWLLWIAALIQEHARLGRGKPREFLPPPFRNGRIHEAFGKPVSEVKQVQRFVTRALAFHPVEAGVGDLAAGRQDFAHKRAAMGGAQDADLGAADGAGFGPALGWGRLAAINSEINGRRNARARWPLAGIAEMLFAMNPHLASPVPLRR